MKFHENSRFFPINAIFCMFDFEIHAKKDKNAKKKAKMHFQFRNSYKKISKREKRKHIYLDFFRFYIPCAFFLHFKPKNSYKKDKNAKKKQTKKFQIAKIQMQKKRRKKYFKKKSKKPVPYTHPQSHKIPDHPECLLCLEKKKRQ